MKLLFLLPLLLVGGCATVPSSGYRDVRDAIATRTGHSTDPTQSADAMLALLLKSPLTADAAAQIALINNKEFAAELEDVGVAQADLIEAGLLKNPVLSLGFGFPTSAPSATRINASFTQNFLDLLTLGRRKKIADKQFQAVKFRIADKALALVVETKTQVYILQADQLLMRRLEAALELEEASAELARLQREAGNIAEIELSRRQSDYAVLHLEVARVRTAELKDRQKLNRLLGIWKPDERWTLAEGLHAIPAQEFHAEDLEAKSLEERLDIAAAKAEYAAVAGELGIARDYRFATGLDVGAQFERDVDRQKTVGPTAAWEIPLFNSGSTRIARAQARLRQSALRLESLAANARLEVRGAIADLTAAKYAASFYQDTLVPAQQQLLKLTQQRYNGMLVGTYDLVHAKQAELTAERGEIEARRDYWSALAELERAVGGVIATENSQPTSKP